MSFNEQREKSQAQSDPMGADERRSILRAATQKIVQSGVAEKALKVGDRLPGFALPNAVGEVISSQGLLKRGPLVVSFYRGAWCPHCSRELHALQEALPHIRKLGAELVAISPNLPDKSLTSIEKHNLTFEVLTDLHNRIARQYGLVITLSEEVRPLYVQMGHDIIGHNGDDSWELPIPATYIVAPNSEIVFSFVNADYSLRAEPEEIIAALKALQATTRA